MSAFSTLSITRQKAIAFLAEKLFGDISDEDLETFLDKELEPRLYNARIVSDDTESNDDDLI